MFVNEQLVCGFGWKGIGIKQEYLAVQLGLSQQAISNLEQRETVEAATLEKVASILKMPVEAIKNYDYDATVNIVANTVTNYDNGALFNYKPNFNRFEKLGSVSV